MRAPSFDFSGDEPIVVTVEESPWGEMEEMIAKKDWDGMGKFINKHIRRSRGGFTMKPPMRLGDLKIYLEYLDLMEGHQNGDTIREEHCEAHTGLPEETA
jgi:hypothetical protein